MITEIHIYHPYIHLHILHPSKYTCTCTYQFTIIKNNSFIQSSFRSEPKKKRPCICLSFSTGSPHLLRKSVNRIAIDTANTYALVPSRPFFFGISGVPHFSLGTTNDSSCYGPTDNNKEIYLFLEL